MPEPAHRRRAAVLALPILLASLPVSVIAADASGTAAEVGRRGVEVVFEEIEKKIIRDFFGERAEPESAKGEDGGRAEGKKSKQKGLPPGLAKKDELPPGLARQLERNGTLPPGLAKRALPGELEAKLGDPPRGYERVIAEGNVLLVEVATGVIRDIVRDVLD